MKICQLVLACFYLPYLKDMDIKGMDARAQPAISGDLTSAELASAKLVDDMGKAID